MKHLALAIIFGAFLCGYASAQTDPSLVVQSGTTTLDVGLTSMGNGVWALASPESYSLDGGTLTLQSATLDSDPSVHYAFSADNAQDAADGSTTPYSMTFTLPNANLTPGAYDVSASVSGSETDGGSNGVVMSPVSGPIQQSFIGGQDAGVDLLPNNVTSSVSATSVPFGPYTATGTYTLLGTASSISTTVNFTVSDNDDASLTGRFDVSAVPEPASAGLGLVALGGFVLLLARARQAKA